MAKSKQTRPGKSQSLSMELDEFKKAAMALRAINHKVRQQMLNLIHNEGEITVKEIYRRLKLEQAVTSAYLGMLRRANIVKTRREGQSIHYSVNYDHISQIENGSKMINQN